MHEGSFDGVVVYVKRVRVYTWGGPQNATKVCYRRRRSSNPLSLTKLADLLPEAVMWKRLMHPNVYTSWLLPLLSSSSFQIGCSVETYWDTSRSTLTRTDLDS